MGTTKRGRIRRKRNKSKEGVIPRDTETNLSKGSKGCVIPRDKKTKLNQKY